jgi:hypothetical protein
MKKKFSWKQWITFSFMLNTIAVFGILFFMTSQTQIQDNNIINGENILPKIQEIALDNANQSYNLYTHDCSEFTLDLVNRLKEINVSAYCVMGFYHSPSIFSAHEWVEVIINGETFFIEATDGTFIPEKTFEREYIPVRRGLCA